MLTHHRFSHVTLAYFSIPRRRPFMQMGQLVGRLHGNEPSDLSDEQLEEVRMITSLPVEEIHAMRKKYRSITREEDMTKTEFYSIPAIAANPLRDQVFKIFELTVDNKVPFIEFARFAAIYSYHSSQDAKLRESFRIHDFDDDGKISRSDLRNYLAITYQSAPEEIESSADAAKRQDETVEMVITRILEEASSDPSSEFLTFDDFVKAVQSTDFESKLIFTF